MFTNDENLGDLNNIPNILCRMAELAAGHTRGETVIADTDFVIDKQICENILALRHGSHKYTYALILFQSRNVVAALHQWGVKAQRDLATVWG